MKNIILIRTGEEYSPRPDEKDSSGKCTDNATKQWKEMERAYFRKICIRRGLAVDGEIKTPERDSLSVLEYKAEMRKQEIRKLEEQETALKGNLRNLQTLIEQAEEKLKAAKKEASRILEEAHAKVDGLMDKINRRLGLIPKKDVEDARINAALYYRKIQEYITDDMVKAINEEDISTLHSIVGDLVVMNPDRTVKEWKPGYREMSDFVSTFENYVKIKRKNVRIDDILNRLENPVKNHKRTR